MPNALIAADVEELLVQYLVAKGLGPATNVSTVMPTTPPLPFYLVNRLDGGDDMVTDYATVSIHAFNSTRTGASDAARTMNQIMKGLTAQVPVQMSDGSFVSIDYLDVIETPAWRFYEDTQIWRYCGRYHIDLRVNQTT